MEKVASKPIILEVATLGLLRARVAEGQLGKLAEAETAAQES